MIPLAIHKELMVQWPGRIYASPDRLKKRLHHLELLLPLLRGMDVLELGCNAGITAYEICKYAKSYVGLEPDRNYYEQFLTVKRHIKNQNVCAYNLTLPWFLSSPGGHDFNAFVMCIALYLLNKNELRLLSKHVFPKCKIVIIQERRASRPSNKKYNPYKLHEPKRILKFLQKNGFDADVYFSRKEKYFEVIGVRN